MDSIIHSDDSNKIDEMKNEISEDFIPPSNTVPKNVLNHKETTDTRSSPIEVIRKLSSAVRLPTLHQHDVPSLSQLRLQHLHLQTNKDKTDLIREISSPDSNNNIPNSFQDRFHTNQRRPRVGTIDSQNIENNRGRPRVGTIDSPNPINNYNSSENYNQRRLTDINSFNNYEISQRRSYLSNNTDTISYDNHRNVARRGSRYSTINFYAEIEEPPNNMKDTIEEMLNDEGDNEKGEGNRESFSGEGQKKEGFFNFMDLSAKQVIVIFEFIHMIIVTFLKL